MKPLSESEKKAVGFLRRGPLTPVMLADQMWDTRKRAHQCYALPAGRVLHRLKARGIVQYGWDRGFDRGMWHLTTFGRAFSV